ncbi:MAG: TetR family transcriptional regulator [Eubacterium sp.]|nr:TetR family transcriptional regulator [Eubacterium sp.]
MTGSKSQLKKNYILDKSKEVFIARGFARVTMKDIVEACGISRGGLYRYFSSTKDIFLALFQRDARDELEKMEVALWENLSARDILQAYIKTQKEEMTGAEPTLFSAAYEFFLENPEDRLIFQWQFDGIAEMLREIIEYGNRRKEFDIANPAAYARHLALVLNSMHLSAPLLNFPEQRIGENLDILLKPCEGK